MTYNEDRAFHADLARYLAQAEADEAADEATYAFYDYYGWEADLDPEDRRFVDFSDVSGQDIRMGVALFD